MKNRRQSEVLRHGWRWLVLAPALALASASLAACQRDDGASCQVPDGAEPSLALTSDEATLAAAAWGPLQASFNNDCTSQTSPPEVISATISGDFIDADGGQGVITLCVPRPDLLGGEQAQTHQLVKGLPLCSACDDAAIGLLDLTLSRDACNIAAIQVTSGTVQSVGYCTTGGDFALTFAATIVFDIACADAEMRQATAELANTVIVAF